MASTNELSVAHGVWSVAEARIVMSLQARYSCANLVVQGGFQFLVRLEFDPGLRQR